MHVGNCLHEDRAWQATIQARGCQYIVGSMAMAVPYVLPTVTWPTTETSKLLVLAAPTTPENIVASSTTTTGKKKTAIDRLGAS